MEDANEFRDAFLRFMASGHTCYVIDVTHLQYIDSSGLGVLVDLQNRTVNQGGRFQITGLQGSIKKLFELTRLNQVFEIV